MPNLARLAGLFQKEGRPLRIEKGRSFQLRGPAGGKLCYVLNGYVLLHLSSRAGKELAVDVVGPGAIIGLGALREEPFHCFEATALSVCEFTCLPARGVRHELSRSPELCMEVLALAHEKLKKRALQLEEFALSPAATRLSRAIIRTYLKITACCRSAIILK